MITLAHSSSDAEEDGDGHDHLPSSSNLGNPFYNSVYVTAITRGLPVSAYP